jgi:hypothetical protein
VSWARLAIGNGDRLHVIASSQRDPCDLLASAPHEDATNEQALWLDGNALAGLWRNSSPPSSAVVVIATGAPPSPSRPTTLAIASAMPSGSRHTSNGSDTIRILCAASTTAALVLAPPTSSPITGIIRAS